MQNSRSILASMLVSLMTVGAVAQTPIPAEPTTDATKPEATTPAPAAPPAEEPKAAEEPKTEAPSADAAAAETPALSAKDIEGLAAVCSDGNEIGKVTKVTETDGKVTAVEVTSPGFFGFMATTYSVPADKVSKKDGKLGLSMTSEEAKKLAK